MFAKTQNFSLPILTIFLVSLTIRLFFLGNHDLITEEAYYWNYAAHLDFGYLDHPPLVAVLIKLSTIVFGVNEFAVRFPALFCWGIAAYFIYRWSELMQKGTGQFSLLLLSILPFFFLNSCITTPDMPLMAAWAGALYFLYQALCLDQKRAWYYAGFWIGLGLLAKYSIALLIMTTGLYILVYPAQRKWLFCKEPYLAICLILVLFSPVIYWNATHDWMSFAFQSTRRLQAKFYFSLHHLVGILILFLTPLGIAGCLQLFKHRSPEWLSLTNRQFIRAFLLGPLSVFTLFSCFRAIKLDWLGPNILAIVPWLAVLMHHHRDTIFKFWLRTSPVLIGAYLLILCCLTYGKPTVLSQFFNPTLSLSWKELTEDLYQIASTVQTNYSEQPILLPLDTYRIESELSFYQYKKWQQAADQVPFPLHHTANFGCAGLMFELWDQQDLSGKIGIFISKDKQTLEKVLLRKNIQSLSSIQTIQAKVPNKSTIVNPYYYQIARLTFSTAPSSSL
jgi:4-amino-4-deoxy-L-arabinose transferase-like glycosyltransferase